MLLVCMGTGSGHDPINAGQVYKISLGKSEKERKKERRSDRWPKPEVTGVTHAEKKSQICFFSSVFFLAFRKFPVPHGVTPIFIPKPTEAKKQA